MPDPAVDEEFGKQLTRLRIATFEQIEQAHELQREAVRNGKPLALADALILTGVITEAIKSNVLGQIQAQQQGGVRQLGPYKLLKKLGEGGMGAVYLAEDSMLLRKAAIKVLPKKYASDSQFLSRFRREAKAAGNLNHENIVGAYAVGEESGVHYYAMEYCEGEPLDQILKRAGAMPWEQALSITLQVARGLQFAHAHGFIHRDIKPANVFMTQEGVVKILDLGLSKNVEHVEADSFTTQSGTTVGTPHYISPEQAKGLKDLDGRTDIYSLGAMLYHLVTGQTPFQGSNSTQILLMHLNEQAPNPRDLNPALPERVAQIIARMMGKDPDDRYADCGELIDDLERVLRGEELARQIWGTAHSSVAASANRRGQQRRGGSERGIEAARRGTTGPRAPVSPHEPASGHPSLTLAGTARIYAGIGAVGALLLVVLLYAWGGTSNAPAGGQPPPEGKESARIIQNIAPAKSAMPNTASAPKTPTPSTATKAVDQIRPNNPPELPLPVVLTKPQSADGLLSAAWEKLKIDGPTPGRRVYITSKMTYDSKRKRCVLFGGENLNDLWVFDLAAKSWSQLEASDPKSPEIGKTRPGVSVYCGLQYEPFADRYWIDFSWAYDPSAGKWTQQTQLTIDTMAPISQMRRPPAFDPARGRLMAIRETRGEPTWWYCFIDQKSAKLEKHPAPFPSRWFDGGLAYGPKPECFVLFGGSNAKEMLNDTWIFRTRENAWTQSKSPTQPLGRDYHELLWADSLDAFVLIGGRNGQIYMMDLWVFDEGKDLWTEVKPESSPRATGPYGASAYDAAQEKIVYYDGRIGETWVLDLRRVGPAPPTTSPPPAATAKASGAAAPFTAHWQKLKLEGTTPGPRTQFCMQFFYDSKRKRNILWGGGGYTIRNADLWALSLDTNRWELIKDPNGSVCTSPIRIEGFAVYDEKRDKYWTSGGTQFDPMLNQWTSRPGNKGSQIIQIRAGASYLPQQDQFVLCGAFAPGGTGCTLVNAQTSEEVSSHKLPDRKLPDKASRWVDGGWAYDPRANMCVLFGGTPSTTAQLQSDTWHFDLATKTWREAKPTLVPHGRSYHRLHWHERMGAIVLVGGKMANGSTTDVWVYETGVERWTQVSADPAPPYLDAFGGSCYDAAHDKVVFYDGKKGETWLLDIKRVGAAATSP